MKKLLFLLGLLLLPNLVSAQITAPAGGTGLTTYSAGDMIYAATTNPIRFTKLNIGASGNCLTSNGSIPAWGSCGTGTFPFDVHVGYNSTSTVLGFLNGFFSTASSTISAPFHLTSLADGNLVVFGGLVQSNASTTFSSPLVYTNSTGAVTCPTCNTSSSFAFPFDVHTGYNSTSTVIGFNGLFSTASSTFGSNLFLTSLAQGNLYTGSNGLVSVVGTSTPTVTSPITYSGTLGQFIGGISGAFACPTCTVGGLTSYDAFTHPYIGASATTSIIGIGTSTPLYPYQMTIASTGPQLALSNGAGVSQWILRNAGGNLYIATSTIQGIATSTTSKGITINNQGWIGIGTTSPNAPLTISPNMGNYEDQTNLGLIVDGRLMTTNGNGAKFGSDVTIGRDLYISDGRTITSTAGDSGGGIDIDAIHSITGYAAPTDTASLFMTTAKTTSGPGIVFDYRDSTGTQVPGWTVANITGYVGINKGGIFDTTHFLLEIASTTGPQLALTGRSTDNSWVFRGIGNTFYIATASPTTFSTTTTFTPLTISPSGTTTLSGLNIVGIATSTSNVGMSITAGCYAIGTTCISGGSGGSGTVTSITAGQGHQNQGLVITTSGTLVGAIATSATPVINPAGLAYWTGAGSASLSATLGTTATGTVTCSGLLSSCGTGTSIIGTNLTLTSSYDAFTHPTYAGASATTSIIGLGTTTPVFQLQIATTSSNGGFKPQLALTDMSGALNSKHWYESSFAGIFEIGTTSDTTYATSSAISISAPTTASPNTTVGIATSTPYATLSVQGVNGQDLMVISSSTSGQALRVDKNGSIYFGNYANCNGTTNALGVTSFQVLCDSLVSDQRLKRDIIPLDNGLDTILKLNPVSFYWKDLTNHNTSDPREQYGFLAQDIQPIIPSAVGQSPDGYLTLDKTALISPIVDAIKTFYKEFQDLVARVTGLEQKMNEQQKEIDNLQEQINLKK